MTQMNADLRGDESLRNHFKRTCWAFAIVFLLGQALGFLLFRTTLFSSFDDDGIWLMLAGTGISYWTVAFRSRALDFKRGWRIIGSLALSAGAAFFTVIAFVFICVLFSGRGT